MFKLNENVKYTPNRGRWLQSLKTGDIITPKVVVNNRGLGFQTRYKNPFAQYRISTVTNDVYHLWKTDPLQLHVGCVNFAVYCATSSLGIAAEHFSGKNPLILSIVKFHLYYHVRKILYELKVKQPFERGFNPSKTDYDKQAYKDLCQDYGANSTWNWSNEYIFSTYQGSRLTYLNSDSWSRWIMSKSQGLTKQGIEMLSETVRIYVYCLLTAQSSTRSNIIGNTGPNFEAQKLFAKEVEDFIKRDMLLHEDIKRYENVLSNARSPVDFSIGEGIYMLPSDLQLKVAKKESFNDKLKVGETGEQGVVKSEVKIRGPEGHKVQVKTIYHSNLTLKDQRLSKENQDELQSLTIYGSLGVIGIIYFLKTR